MKKARRPRQASEWLVVGHGHVARVSMHTHTPKSGCVVMGKATVVVAVCVDDVMGCACHPHTPHTGRESSHKGTCHPHHVCVCEAEEWAVDEHSGLVVCGGGWRRGMAWWLVVAKAQKGVSVDGG